jgi:D-alanyl-D-alanine carboxypeptidase
MGNCLFREGDRVDSDGVCGIVVKKSPLGDDGWILKVQTGSEHKFISCDQATPCKHTGAAAAPPAAPVAHEAAAPAAVPVPATAPPRPAVEPAEVAVAIGAALPPVPVGRQAVIDTFGNPTEFVNHKDIWEGHVLANASLAIPLIYAYDVSKTVSRVRAHRLVVAHLADTLNECLRAGVARNRLKYGGCYQWRAIRGSSALSLHTWGIAIDIEPEENPLGQRWSDDGRRLDARVIQVFKSRGWFWGGDFQNRADPQHFQWARGT